MRKSNFQSYACATLFRFGRGDRDAGIERESTRVHYRWDAGTRDLDPERKGVLASAPGRVNGDRGRRCDRDIKERTADDDDGSAR